MLQLTAIWELFICYSVKGKPRWANIKKLMELNEEMAGTRFGEIHKDRLLNVSP
jgi:hypothetical protein